MGRTHTMDKNSYFLGLYEKAMPNEFDFQKKLKLCKDSGFDHVEISIDETDEKLRRLYNGYESHLIEVISNTDIRVRSMCLSGHRKYPLGSHDGEVRKKSIDIFERAVQFSEKVGIRLIQLAGYDVYYEDSDCDTVKYFIENLDLCTRYAAKYGINLGFETMETEFMDTISKAIKFVDMINSPYLGVYPDIGNLKNACVKYGLDVVDEIKAGKGHIFAAHLKETVPNVYRDMDFGTGHTEYERSIEALYAQGVQLFTGEFWYKKEGDLDKLSLSSKFLREKLDKCI